MSALSALSDVAGLAAAFPDVLDLVESPRRRGFVAGTFLALWLAFVAVLSSLTLVKTGLPVAIFLVGMAHSIESNGSKKKTVYIVYAQLRITTRSIHSA
jgi:hypothetical protein